MTIVAGVDFGTQSVRVSVVDNKKGRLGTAVAPYPVIRHRENPDHASQRHTDHLSAFEQAMAEALFSAKIDGHEIAALAIATTGSTVVPVDEHLIPLDEYYLWCDHRAAEEARQITDRALATNLESIFWSGGVCSAEMGLPKYLHWMRNNPEKRDKMATFIEHCDYMVALLTGVKHPGDIKRSVCAAGHKWMWNRDLGGFPPKEFLVSVDPLFEDFHERMAGTFAASNTIAGTLCKEWADRLELREGIPIPVSGIDAHWDSIGTGIEEGDIVNVVGTSTCIMAIVQDVAPIPGVFGIVDGSIHPKLTGIEAGLSATGDLFEGIARRANCSVAELCGGMEDYKPGQTGLLRLTWDNGDRNVLSNPELGGITLGWNLMHTQRDELFAAIEGMAFHTRIIMDRIREYGVEIHRVINGGGIPRKNPVLNQVYADVFNCPVLVPKEQITSLGSAIFAFLAAGVYASVEEAQDSLCPSYDVIQPRPQAVAVYRKLFEIYKNLYFGFGEENSLPVSLGKILPELRRIAAMQAPTKHHG